MKINIFHLLLTFPILFFYGMASGQSIEKLEIAKHSGNFDQKVHIAELNNDAYHDLIITQKINADSIVAFIYFQIDSLVFSAADTILNLASDHIFLTDIDNSGQFDIIIYESDSGENYISALTDYNFTNGFKKLVMKQLDLVTDFSISDVNHDGLKDLLIIESDTSSNSFNIFLQKEEFYFDQEFTFPNISKFLTTSFNGDGLVDLLLFDSLRNELNILTGKENKWDTLKYSFDKAIDDWQNADLNYDGKSDILITSNHNNTGEISALILDSATYTEKQILLFNDSIWFSVAGDFSNDGLYDISITSNQSHLIELDSLGEIKNTMLIDSTTNVKIKGAGDIDNDGDLDWIGFINNNDSTDIILYINQTTQNSGPFYVPLIFPETIGEQTKFKWNRTNDDKTPSASLSYDFYIESTQNSSYIITPDYDLVDSPKEGTRNLSRHGYTLFDTTYTINNLISGKYYWGIAGVDNAYYSSTDIRNCNNFGACDNENFISQCLEIFRKDTLVCTNDTMNLSFGSESDSVVWLSTKKGLLDYGNDISYHITGKDVVYAIAIPKTPCDDPLNACTKNFSLNVDTRPSRGFIKDTYKACEDSINSYTIEGDFSSIQWFTNSEILSDSNTVNFTNFLDSIFVRITTADDFCPTYDTLFIEKPAKPDLNLLEDNISACFGNTIDINVNIPDSLAESITYSIEIDGEPLPSLLPQITVTDTTLVTINSTYLNCHQHQDTLLVTPIYPPQITVTGNTSIFIGESTELQASGATNYEWIPANHLSNPYGQNTTASPEVTTTYQVYGWDIEGCNGKAEITIEVILSVFIPDLFTPNGDGNNDRLIVHGTQIDYLDFSIYDGNGKVIYQTSSLSEITAQGWNGTQNGNAIPPGTYIWKVEGKFDNGEPITYKGKKMGEIKVVR